MISHWEVIRNVASRYGDREGQFVESAEKLALVKEGKVPLVSLEDDLNRVEYRFARKGDGVERVMGAVNFQDKFVLDKLSAMARSVCRILHRGTPIGTGFLIAEDILITNHHVITDSADAGQMLAEFNFELDANLVPRTSACFKLDPDKFFLTSTLEVNPAVCHSGLDFTMIGVRREGVKGESLTQFPPVFLDGNKGKIIKGEGCVIIQHPRGLPKKIVLKDISFFSETGTRLVYESDTLPGSSGSMVVGLGTCEVIALHHSGLPKTDAENRILTKTGDLATRYTLDEDIAWLGNEGIKVSRIILALEEAVLPAGMEQGRRALLRKTEVVAGQIQHNLGMADPLREAGGTVREDNASPTKTTSGPPVPGTGRTDKTDFLMTARNRAETIRQIEEYLVGHFGQEISLELSMPASAQEGEVELFHFSAPSKGDPEEEVRKLLQLPEILNLEVDRPLRLNADPGLVAAVPATERVVESDQSPEPEFEARVEEDFLRAYSVENQSPYVDGKEPSAFRRWNWAATRFQEAIREDNVSLPKERGIRVVQFDTGYSRHSKVEGGFDLSQDFTFLEARDETDALDLLTRGLGKNPGHGTRTGSILIGRENTMIPNEGNIGLLTRSGSTLVPYRVAETVIIIDRQQQLAAALDRAISQGFDIITMSMGLPPTIATAQMAKKAYDKGIIWCCAAGNVVQAVVAPAVFPGTIAVAASNPLDRDWSGSSRGEAVDITAPGEDVYVPVWKEKNLGDPLEEAFAYGNGTSYAVPHVAAAAAYWLAIHQETLRSTAYGGWKRVEAFRQALCLSARRDNQLPRRGFGAGMLDAEALFQTTPPKAATLKYAYNGWNEHAFFASLQGYQELVKTYWNRAHGWVFGTRRGGQESLVPELPGLSPFSQGLEQSLFPETSRTEEALGDPTPEETLERFQAVHMKIMASAR